MRESYGATALMETWNARVHDPRVRIRTGFPSLDYDLHRGGFAPGELVILGGRTHTRKTTVMLNMVANLLRTKVRVGFVALDETLAGYTSKLTSSLSGLPMEDLEERWEETEAARAEATGTMNGYLSVIRKPRPSFDFLTTWFEDIAPMDYAAGASPQVVFIDYTSLLGRDKYAGQEVQRISRLIEDLQVWTAEHECVTIALHQVGRMDEGRGARYHGDTPLTLESLKYGGEEIADVVLGTYRPSLDPLGNMAMDEAAAALGDKFDEEKWEDARNRVRVYEGITFLQLLKNRPGVRLNQKGVQLRSPSSSLAMVQADGELAIDDGKVVPLHG